MVSIVALLLVCACHTPSAGPPLPVLGTVPAFALTDSHGRAFGDGSLRGQVWIANFIFTRCPDICPLFTAKMGEVEKQTRAGRAPQLVSFSVDPTYDTPAVLTAYAAAHDATVARWHFVTGDPVAVKTAVEKGLMTAMEPEGEKNGVPQIGHGSHFVLVDAELHIRGVYDMNDADAVARVVRDAGRL